jgi:hypothetical protein
MHGTLGPASPGESFGGQPTVGPKDGLWTKGRPRTKNRAPWTILRWAPSEHRALLIRLDRMTRTPPRKASEVNPL